MSLLASGILRDNPHPQPPLPLRARGSKTNFLFPSPFLGELSFFGRGARGEGLIIFHVTSVKK
jgi:hypothetical protein